MSGRERVAACSEIFMASPAEGELEMTEGDSQALKGDGIESSISKLCQ